MGVFSGNLNLFRILGDLSHVSSIVILIWAIHANRSAEGVSLLTQALYALVFVARYLDILWTPVLVGRHSELRDRRFLLVYQFCGKLFFITTSLYLVLIIGRVYARTREKEKAWRRGIYCLVASALLATPVAWVFQNFPQDDAYEFKFSNVVWTFSIILESVCVIPQLLLLRQTSVPTVIDSYYLLALGSYRAFYILNWITKAANDAHFDPISVVFGVVQTALYVDFAYVYYTRQRVKLRNGGVVDSDDFRQGLLVRRFLGGGRRAGGVDDDDDDEEEGGGGARHGEGGANGQAGAAAGTRWGVRGISVSADEGVQRKGDKLADEERGLTDPEAFEDDDDDDNHPDVGPEQNGKKSNGHTSGVSNGEEWREGERH